MTNLATTFCSITFPNPFILPSGIITEIPAHKKAEESGAGGITTKSLTVEKREGYPIPRIIRFDQGFLNSVGFRGPGIKAGKDQVKNLIKSVKVPLLSNFLPIIPRLHKSPKPAKKLVPMPYQLSILSVPV